MADSPPAGPLPDGPLAAALADRYVFQRVLGRGGMATVYLVQDVRHERPVALKVLHPELAAALGAERFQREVKLAARLQHPHILTVHDSGDTAGRLWFTMPYVEGESLRGRLERERQLPIRDALRIGREAASALAYAHRHGVVHRDIKPENIMITADGDTLVADFGIARALGAGEERLTETGLAIGTPAYMSPEQASGDRTVDARSDVYSLGAVLYEMLAGEPPFTGPTAQAMLARRFTETPRPLRQARETVPEPVERAVMTALARSPADRFATATDFALALEVAAATAVPPGGASAVTTPMPAATAGAARDTAAAPAVPAPGARGGKRTLLVAGIAFLLGLGVLFAWRQSHESGPATGKTLAVLPFENLGDSTDAYFADGITDEVRGKLASLPALRVIARGSSVQYRHSGKSPEEIAHELGAAYLLTATVRWEKNAAGASRVRVSPELVEAEPGSAPVTRWQQPFDATMTDVFQVQADIAGRVAQALGVELGGEERTRLTERPTVNLAAYDAFLRGEAASNRSADQATMREAAAAYEEAVRLDPGFALAWARLTRTRSLLYVNGVPSPELGAAARDAAERAIAIAPRRPDGYIARGSYFATVARAPDSALADYDRAEKLAPPGAELLTAIALADQRAGRWEQGLARLEDAERLDPRSSVGAFRRGRALLWLRRYADAAPVLDRAQTLAPQNLDVFETRGMLRLAQGDLPGAQAVFRAAAGAVAPSAVAAFMANYWDLYWALDDDQQRLALALTPGAFDDDRSAWGISLAEIYSLRGDVTRARAYADSARAALEQQLVAAPDDPQRHAIHGLALAYLGRKADAVAEGERAVAMLPSARDGFNGPYYQMILTRIYLRVGEPEKALDHLEPLLHQPFYISPAWLRIDPTFGPLRGNPRFEKLAAGT